MLFQMRNSKCSDLRKVAMLLSLSHTQAQQKHYFPTIKTLETQINKNTPSHSQLNKLKKNCLILSVFRISSPVPYYTTEELQGIWDYSSGKLQEERSRLLALYCYPQLQLRPGALTTSQQAELVILLSSSLSKSTAAKPDEVEMIQVFGRYFSGLFDRGTFRHQV